MTTIAETALPAAAQPAELWQSVADVTRAWLAERGVDAADAVVLLPFADLLAPARRAFGHTAQWLPRLHTPRTLATALGPPRPRAAGELTGDSAIDSATARAMLRGHAWAAQWLQRDPHAFDAALQRLMRTAHTLCHGAAARHPSERAAWWDLARQHAVGGRGPGSTHRLLLRVAIEWAALSDAADTDRLFEHRPSAWVVVTLGGSDLLAQGVLQHAHAHGIPTLHLTADPADLDPMTEWQEHCVFELSHAADAETEAMATAWQVADHLRRGDAPLALIAQDRAVVRRVRALLERMRVNVVDETGWSLSTTRAGAHAIAALRAARSRAPSDDILDWLKADLGDARAADLATLETLWRGQRVNDAQRRARAHALWQHEQARLEAFANPRRRALGPWLRALDALLFDATHADIWRDDAAAVQLRQALRLQQWDTSDGAWQAAAATLMSLDEFATWIEATLEEATFVPPAAAASASVVITPLSRAIGRAFACAVLPGADAQHLGPLPAETTLLDDSLRRALGLPDRAARQRRAALSFVHLLRLPKVVALHRRADADEMLPVSPWIERLRLARRERGAPAVLEREAAWPQREVQPVAMQRPSPNAAGRLPASLSASAIEALRQCPYRFFSRAVLHLSEHDELDDEADKRDAGRWLHATLEQFHRDRAVPRSRLDDVARLLDVGQDALARLAQEAGVSEESMLPFTAGLPQLADRYVRWLHEEEARGWRFDAAEVTLKAVHEDDAGLRIHGRIDRIDRRGTDRRLIDYKTNSRKSLQRKVQPPLEDTQLAVYAALQLQQSGDSAGDLQACYLALDDPQVVTAVPHPSVADTARRLVHEVRAERARIDGGAPLPALGEGRVCETCEARGLCRRDHWSAVQEEPAGAR